jgi:site-specific recombinase XerD
MVTTRNTLAPETPQITPRNNISALAAMIDDADALDTWRDAYFSFEVTTAESSQKVQRRDIELLLTFMKGETGNLRRMDWTPRLSKSFLTAKRGELNTKGTRTRSDSTLNRIVAHLKTFSKWIHKMRAFPLGNPMEKIKQEAVGLGLEIERAITPQERNRILDAADNLPISAHRSRDRTRHRAGERPQRANFRPYRNRAMVYALTETGMRRAAVTKILLADVSFTKRSILTEEKGGHRHEYKISNEGIEALRKYIELERPEDDSKWQSPYLFLAANNSPRGKGSLGEKTVNSVWDDVCELAGVEGRTPHSARHGMGKHVMDKTGNIAAVQRQLGHKTAKYSASYARITGEELQDVLNDRG